MNYKKYISLTIFTILFAGIIFVLFYNKIIYPTIWPVVKNNTLMIFHDWSYVVNSSLCFEKGYDVYLNNPCETLSNPFIYGKIILYLPFVENNLNFYYFVVPIVFNIIFLFVCLSFFYKENKLLYLILSIIFIFSVPFLLAIERANIDILIALIIFLLAKFKNIYLNIFFIIMISISKFYPICLNIIFIFNKNLKIFLKYFFLTNIIILSFLFFQKDSLIKIFNNKALVDSSGIYNFSFSGILESSNNVSVLIILLYLFIFLLFTIFFSKKILSNNDITRLINSNIYENRLFILSSTTLIFCYFVFSNYIYREIFFLGLIPWILKNNNNSNNNLPALLLILLSLKFILTTLIVFINLNNILPDLNIELVILKHFLDFLTILPLINILLILSFYFFKEIKVN